MSASVLIDSRWSRVGDVSPGSLSDARLQVHHAAQIVVSAAISYLPARSDDSHTALCWSAAHRALVSEPITAAAPLRIGLRVEDLTLLRLDGESRAARLFPLGGRTLEDGHAWLGDVVAESGLDRARLTSRKHYTIHAHPVADGKPFSADLGDSLMELARYWSNGSLVLEDFARSTSEASPVLTWPHHFDIATLVEVPSASGARRTIGVGHSPGDEWYAEPYWYVGPSPYPSTEKLPALAAGHWHTKGWVGAALRAGEYVSAVDQPAAVLRFVESAVSACRSLL